ncbi:unnamed protein product, partial [Amoebophrya sp. A25]|eukprot:GSA25T00011240001.1
MSTNSEATSSTLATASSRASFTSAVLDEAVPPLRLTRSKTCSIPLLKRVARCSRIRCAGLCILAGFLLAAAMQRIVLVSNQLSTAQQQQLHAHSRRIHQGSDDATTAGASVSASPTAASASRSPAAASSGIPAPGTPPTTGDSVEHQVRSLPSHSPKAYQPKMSPPPSPSPSPGPQGSPRPRALHVNTTKAARGSRSPYQVQYSLQHHGGKNSHQAFSQFLSGGSTGSYGLPASGSRAKGEAPDTRRPSPSYSPEEPNSPTTATATRRPLDLQLRATIALQPPGKLVRGKSDPVGGRLNNFLATFGGNAENPTSTTSTGAYDSLRGSGDASVSGSELTAERP